MGMLLVRIIKFGEHIPGSLMAFVGAGAALYYTQVGDKPIARQELFTGMLVNDEFTAFVRVVLLVFTLLFIAFTYLTRMPARENSVDFYCLVLGSVLGMCLMASANHLLMVFMAVEMASVPSYVMAGILRSNKKSSEAALKYAIYGAGTAGVMLYGISLIAGVVNTVHIPTIAIKLSEGMATMSGGEQTALVIGGLMLMAGLAFKLSAVPFHFWCPDVFEGASAEVAAFLSVASKAAALALLVRVAIGIGFLGPEDTSSLEVAAVQSDGLFAVEDVSAVSPTAGEGKTDPLSPVRGFLGLLIAFIATITCTFGNLAAYAQTNIKRLMAYSTIAHAGYMMLAVPAALATATVSPDVARDSIASLGLYITTYVIMNLGAFAVIAFFRNAFGSEEIADYAGIVRRSPVVVILFTIILFSLVGLPPFAGFLGKFAIFRSLANAYEATGSFHLIALLFVGGINTAISLFYYLKVAKVMIIDPESDAAPARPLALVSSLQFAYLFLLAVPVATLLIYLDPLNKWTQAAAQQLF